MVVLPTEVGAQYNRNYIYWMGQQCMVDNNYREAIDVLNVLLRSDDKDFDAYFLRGIAKYNMDDLLGADADFSRAVMLNPVFTGAFYYRAITRSRLGNYDDALSDFRQAIELRPDLRGRARRSLAVSIGMHRAIVRQRHCSRLGCGQHAPPPLT